MTWKSSKLLAYIWDTVRKKKHYDKLDLSKTMKYYSVYDSIRIWMFGIELSIIDLSTSICYIYAVSKEIKNE